uniref:Uncharacterized protein LOC114913486 n=1 Tax=Elaeis guineensis var. tenera TaxID=51953 RepID=A0A8N4IDR2_ELAGV|nr:uncharacterized protein LOC114913486 [Elaeis guineensis]
MRLPRGYRFDPKPWELIGYLQDKVEGRPDAGQGVINDGIDAYGCSPKQLVGCLILHDDGRSFFFTPIKHRNRKCRDRSTPDGHWKLTKKTILRNGEGRLVGYMKELCYFHGKRKSGKKEPERTKWLMKEYTLDHEQPKMALCEIYSAQNKCKGRIQGNERGFQPLKLQEPIDSESEDTRFYYPSNDSSSWGKATEDESHQYLKSIAEKTGDSCDKILFMARNLDTAGEPKFSKPEERVGPNERGGFFSSKEEEGSLSAAATSAGCLSGGDGHTGFNSVAGEMDCIQFISGFFSSQESPIVHADAASKEGGSVEVVAYPDMLPNTNALDMLQDSFIFGCGEMDGLLSNSHDLFY